MVPRVFTKVSMVLIFASAPDNTLSKVVLDIPHLSAIWTLFSLLVFTSSFNFLIFIYLLFSVH